MPKIMLVEDDNNLREIYGERLMAEGYEIVSAGDGEEALALAVKEKPDLIISDVMMPKISGFDMLDILRQTPETKFTKVIMMTALSQTEDKDRADRLGADKYLVKSQVTLEDVARVVHDLIYGPDEAEAATASAGPETATQQPIVTAPVAVATPPADPALATAEPVVAAAEPVSPIVDTTPAPVAPVAPVAVPEPVVTPAVEPVAAPEPATPVFDAAPSEPVSPFVVTEPATEPSAPIVNPITGGTALEPVSPSAVADSANAQSAAEESAAITEQIESFVSNDATQEPAHESPLVEPTEQDLIHAQNAVEDPNVIPATLPETNQPSAPAEPVDPTVPPVIQDGGNVPEPAGVRKKVIQPINDPTSAQPNIYELYEKEMAEEAASSPVINSANVEAPVQEEPLGNPITDPAQSAATAPALETVDLNAIEGLDMGDQAVPAPTETPAAPVAPQAAIDAVPDPNDPAAFAL